MKGKIDGGLGKRENLRGSGAPPDMLVTAGE